MKKAHQLNHRDSLGCPSRHYCFKYTDHSLLGIAMISYPTVAILIGASATYVTSTVTANIIARMYFPLPSSDKRIGCIDGLRGYLAVSVLICHFIVWMQVQRLGGTWDRSSINFFAQLGSGSVALFFMTTGFVFYPRVLKGFRNCSWFAIYTTRFFRIIPLIVFSVAIITTIIYFRTGRGIDNGFMLAAAKWVTTWSQPPLLGYSDSARLNAYVLWSLWFEWLFYLFVLPACAAAMDLLRHRLPSWIVPLALLTATLAARVLQLPIPIMEYLPLFAIGMLAYECQRREWIARVLRRLSTAAAAAIALGVGMTVAPTPNDFALPLFSLFFTCVACGNSMGGLLRTTGALVLGECSYGIYLLHGIILNLLFVDAFWVMSPVPTDYLPVALPIVAICLVFVTSFTYLLVERPMIRAGSFLAKQWTGRRLRANVPELEVAP